MKANLKNTREKPIEARLCANTHTASVTFFMTITVPMSKIKLKDFIGTFSNALEPYSSTRLNYSEWPILDGKNTIFRSNLDQEN